MEREKLSPFQLTILTYLEHKASEDELFSVTFNKPNKSIEECCEYITQEAKKKAQNNCAILTDDEVFGMAIHYYDEDSIVVKKPQVSSAVAIKNAQTPIKTTPVAPSVSKTKKKKPTDDDQPLLFDFEDEL